MEEHLQRQDEHGEQETGPVLDSSSEAPSADGEEESLPELSFEETRVLGSLIEKELTTPEYYPMTLNALVNACNQKNNRFPKCTLSEDKVSDTIEGMRLKRLVMSMALVGSRVPKFSHNAEKTLDLIKPERALLCELLNRGPQTSGELRSRAARMYEFDDLADVEETLAELRDRSPALVAEMDPAPGQKDRRWLHLLAPPPTLEERGSPTYSPSARNNERFDAISTEIKELREEVEALRHQLREISDAFRVFQQQFE